MGIAFWVFGYGSLIWNPGFPYVDRQKARLDGWRRSFCMTSIHHRGTVEAPGLVLALDAAPGEGCDGVAFAVDEQAAGSTLADLRERELVSSAYLEATCPVVLSDGRRVEAITYVMDRTHPQYCPGLGLEDQARIIAAAAGGRGPNRDYLFSTAEHLGQIGLADPELDRLAALVRALPGP